VRGHLAVQRRFDGDEEGNTTKHQIFADRSRIKAKRLRECDLGRTATESFALQNSTSNMFAVSASNLFAVSASNLLAIRK